MIGINHLGKKYERLANQMFQYAAIKGIAKNRGFMYCIPPSKYASQDDQWSEHQLFSTFELKNLSTLQVQYLDEDKPVIHEETFTFNEDLFNNCPDNISLYGFFQSEKYFLNVRDELLEDFAFKNGLDGSGNETWSQITTINSSDANMDDYFGRSVSIDGNHAIIGAYGNDDTNTETGSAYIFKLTGDDNKNVPVEKTKLTNAGISSSNITAIENAVVTNNSTVTVLKDKGLDTTEKRAAAIRLIFAKNTSITKFKTKGTDINLDVRLNKTNYSVYKKGSSVTLTDDIAGDNGVYSDISETGDTITFKKDSAGQEITFTKVAGGYTATGSTKVWKAGQRYTVDGVSYYFD